MENTASKARLVMAVLSALIGIFLIAVSPSIIQISLERVLKSLLAGTLTLFLLIPSFKARLLGEKPSE